MTKRRVNKWLCWFRGHVWSYKENSLSAPITRFCLRCSIKQEWNFCTNFEWKNCVRKIEVNKKQEV